MNPLEAVLRTMSFRPFDRHTCHVCGQDSFAGAIWYMTHLDSWRCEKHGGHGISVDGKPVYFDKDSKPPITVTVRLVCDGKIEEFGHSLFNTEDSLRMAVDCFETNRGPILSIVDNTGRTLYLGVAEPHELGVM